ncbi:basic helix-loop-helix (bHLH) DNA-binding superfamily protein [Arabidopsis thaliana]|uniref:Basic helix-loop-helix (BHLH) DNA-binding superfamily protein n=1 Tax=Arabidopsis thaliana TaxID=3702 RepID=A0A1P8ASA4_ARATH|nr:basic helix-loop-helix (bHLH) DNA-binding superfamily protein [Arabidopsis thaliana]ANM59543.1 basic helix-loop-helix (bHLH) DNA-binding superfamily protein [Arabidopsis thaliana]|eukprot:NP_001321893.1 basic helix-loop-helix (bHLH) DNA-binding superfamily protein [Arabidopsis thaliana]
MLREECTPSSSWWEDVQHHHNDHANSISSTSFYHKSSNNNSHANASCEEDNLSVSTVRASNRLDLTAESSNHHSLSASNQPASSSDELLRDHVVSSHNHLWSLAFLPGRSLGDQMMDHHHHIASRNSSTTSELPSFEPACHNGNGNGWIYDPNQVRYDQSSDQRLSKLTDLVGKHWSIAPPNNPDMNHNLHHHFDHDHSQNDDISMYRQALEVKNEEDLCYNNGSSGGGSLFHDPIESSRSFLDIRLSRPLTDINPSFKPCFKALNVSEFNKKEHQTASLLFLQAAVRLGTTNAGKKKRCEEISDEVSKKAKCSEGSTLSPEKELPKAKLRDKITTLQQIVSPFGKVLQKKTVLLFFICCHIILKIFYFCNSF